jgi:cobyrinic acid a,c-diamide synthase
LKSCIEKNMPVYAECGGLMYLGENLVVDGNTYPMVGALPFTCVMEKKPQGHGYTIMDVTGPNPYFTIGEIIKGHEFHYSRPVVHESEDVQTVFTVKRGLGFDGKRDGLCKNNLLATYTHLHAVGYPSWSKRFFETALRFGSTQNKK